MNKKFWYIVTASLFTIAGCQSGATEDEEALYKKNGNTINVSERNEIYNEEDMTDNRGKSRYGFVRHQKSSTGNNANLYQKIATFDREKAADTISRLAVAIPNINDVATLVTDEEVLIGYKTDADNRMEAADQVKRTAMSVIPRYYHVYVTDNPQIMQDIENYSTVGSTTPNIEQSIENTIRDMLKSPQGRKMSDGEDANGEMKNELNDPIDGDVKNRSSMEHQLKD
ncbi:YhcN/YlaJ family sporulation lipoprotein [Bacillus songklensis]|uniref:YhcN/YlaJ family sporulation lipoprotein n=1 Tax=Bacillus songklensis TaxID=1069116 RepID=A0ABV8B948_9BACI